MKRQKPLILLLGFATGLLGIILLRNNNLGNDWFDLLAHIPYYDKLGHLFLMGILSFLAVIAIAPLIPGSKLRATITVLFVVLTLIALEEYSQIFVATRTFSLIDLLCDLLGVACFGLLGYSQVKKHDV